MYLTIVLFHKVRLLKYLVQVITERFLSIHLLLYSMFFWAFSKEVSLSVTSKWSLLMLLMTWCYSGNAHNTAVTTICRFALSLWMIFLLSCDIPSFPNYSRGVKYFFPISNIFWSSSSIGLSRQFPRRLVIQLFFIYSLSQLLPPKDLVNSIEENGFQIKLNIITLSYTNYENKYELFVFLFL